jgi:hypothetical protein
MGGAGDRRSDLIRGKKAHEGPSILELTRARFSEDTAIAKDQCPRCNHGVATLEILSRVGLSCVDTDDQRATNMLAGSKRGALLELFRYSSHCAERQFHQSGHALNNVNLGVSNEGNFQQDVYRHGDPCNTWGINSIGRLCLNSSRRRFSERHASESADLNHHRFEAE